MGSDLLIKSEPEYVKEIGTDSDYKHEVVWLNVIGLLIIHILAFYGFILIFTDANKWTTLWGILCIYASAAGISVGAHRFYTHRSFKATPLLRLVFIILHTLAGQNCMSRWVRNHRLHHCYTDTDADPHNARRGFFFSHVGWLMYHKHPSVIEKGRLIDISDMTADPMIQFQKKYYVPLFIILTIGLPVAVPIVYWNETFVNSIFVSFFTRWVVTLNASWLVNSAAHLYGTRPYDKNLQPVETWFVSLITLGEGWHNFHHAFPWDYKASEYGMHFNLNAIIIELLEKLGLVYDLKTLSQTTVEKRIMKTGDGTHYALGDESVKNNVTAAYGLLVHPFNPTYRTVLPSTQM